MWQLADEVLDNFLARGKGEFIKGFASPFTLLVIADLLGIPPEDRNAFVDGICAALRRWRRQHQQGVAVAHRRWSSSTASSRTYVAGPSAEPARRHPDRVGHRTVPRRHHTHPRRRRARRDQRLLGGPGDHGPPARHGAEGARRSTRHPEAGARGPQPAPELHRGGAAPRKPGQGRLPAVAYAGHRRRTRTGRGHHRHGAQRCGQPRPASLRGSRLRSTPTRKNARQHLAFGRGIHSCPGAPLARAETRVGLERLLDRTSDIRISEEKHGPAGHRDYRYIPTFILRGLTELHLEFDVNEARRGA